MAAERGVEQRQVRDPARVGDRDLAIQDGTAHRQLGQQLGDRREATGRIVAGAGLEAAPPRSR